MQGSGAFSRRVWEIATSIPAGRVMTYGGLARAAGSDAMAARSITSILSKAPNQGVIPYHRIVYANGKVWFSSKGEESRRALYKREGIHISDRGVLANLDDILWQPE